MKILKLIGFVVLFGCILSTDLLASNIQINQIQTQKKTMILNHLENNDLISSEIKKLGDKKEDVLCLALNMYHEARGSTIEDQIATTYVVFNRLEDKNYPLFYPKNEKSRGRALPYGKSSVPEIVQELLRKVKLKNLKK